MAEKRDHTASLLCFPVMWICPRQEEKDRRAVHESYGVPGHCLLGVLDLVKAAQNDAGYENFKTLIGIIVIDRNDVFNTFQAV